MNEAAVTSQDDDKFEDTRTNLHRNRFEFTKLEPDTVTTLLPEMGPEVGNTDNKTALKFNGVKGTMEKFPFTDPGGAGGQHVGLEGLDTGTKPP